MNQLECNQKHYKLSINIIHCSEANFMAFKINWMKTLNLPLPPKITDDPHGKDNHEITLYAVKKGFGTNSRETIWI